MIRCSTSWEASASVYCDDDLYRLCDILLTCALLVCLSICAIIYDGSAVAWGVPLPEQAQPDIAVLDLDSLFPDSRLGVLGVQFYVAPDGDDAFPGTMEQPFRTLPRAQRAVIADRETSHLPVTVWLRQGVYRLRTPLAFAEQDSGREGQPVSYRAFPGEIVRISGGVEVTGWRLVTDRNILQQLAPEARKHVVQADLKKLGIADYGLPDGKGLELFFADKPMQLARWPNSGFVTIAGLVEPGTRKVRGKTGSITGKFYYQGNAPARWQQEADVWLHGYWFFDWSSQRQQVESIDTKQKIISLKEPYHHYGYRTGQWYYAYNILAELDQPGEYYLDRTTGMLYFWPPSGQGMAVVSVADNLLVAKQASHLRFERLIFEHSRADAVVMRNGEDNHFAGCTFRNLGGRAVVMNKASKSGVRSSEIYDIGQGGISLSGGDRKRLLPGRNYSLNNHIYRFGRTKPVYSPGISLKGVGNLAVHNTIHDAPHQAIAFAGNNQLIEMNEIYNVCQGSNDAGAIYAGRDWTVRGTRIRNNYFHDIYGFENKGAKGVYLDDMLPGTDVSGNLFYRVHEAVHIGGGRDNSVVNNMFVDCPRPLHGDARGLGWARYSIDKTLKPRLERMPYRSDIWQRQYPELAAILDDEPGAPRGNNIRRNVVVGKNFDDINPKIRHYYSFADNLVTPDPKFCGKPPESFKLCQDSPAWQIGFHPLHPVTDFGIFEDRYRSGRLEPAF